MKENSEVDTYAVCTSANFVEPENLFTIFSDNSFASCLSGFLNITLFGQPFFQSDNYYWHQCPSCIKVLVVKAGPYLFFTTKLTQLDNTS